MFLEYLLHVLILCMLDQNDSVRKKDREQGLHVETGVYMEVRDEGGGWGVKIYKVIITER